MGVSRDGWKGRQHWRERLTNNEKSAEAGLRLGFRSGLEEKNAKKLEALGVAVLFETTRVPYLRPETLHHYTPDFEVPRKPIMIETKGKFESSDRCKHLLVKAQHPHMDLRFVFQRPHDRLTKVSRTTYAQWAEKYGFRWATGVIPDAWIVEAKGWEGEPVRISLVAAPTPTKGRVQA
jgi:Phage endonuclease I